MNVRKDKSWSRCETLALVGEFLGQKVAFFSNAERRFMVSKHLALQCAATWASQPALNLFQ